MNNLVSEVGGYYHTSPSTQKKIPKTITCKSQQSNTWL